MIVAMASNRVIGVQNDLPWHIPEDMRYFRRVTTGHAIIMGRKTFASVGGRALPKRLNVVVSRTSKGPTTEELAYATDLSHALKLCAAQSDKWGDEVFICGGGEIYRQALPLTQRVHLTTIKQAYAGEVTFPELGAEFCIVDGSHASFAEPFPYERVILERVAGKQP